SAFVMRPCKAASLNTLHHGKSAKDCESAGVTCARNSGGTGVSGFLYWGPTTQAPSMRSGISAAINFPGTCGAEGCVFMAVPSLDGGEHLSESGEREQRVDGANHEHDRKLIPHHRQGRIPEQHGL